MGAMRQRGDIVDELKTFEWLHKAESQHDEAAGRGGLIHFVRELHLRKVVISQRVIPDVFENPHSMMMKRVVDAVQQIMPYLDQLGHAGTQHKEDQYNAGTFQVHDGAKIQFLKSPATDIAPARLFWESNTG
jgi:hypothetical protein